jgi:hypothetical protein
VSKARATTKRPEDNSQAWRVVDDLARAHCIDPAELDAVEAFLMSQLNAILAADTKNVQNVTAASRADSEAPQYPALEKAEQR